MKADYSLPFVFNLSVLLFIQHITLMPQQLIFFKTLFERDHVVSLLESQAILPSSVPVFSNIVKRTPTNSTGVVSL